MKGFIKWLNLVLGVLLVSSSPSFASTSPECIRRVVWAEAGNQSQQGQQAVAHVILNRSKQKNKTPCAVVAEPHQFTNHRTPPESFSFSVKYPDPTGGATYFQRKDGKFWGPKRKYIRIGAHTFYGD